MKPRVHSLITVLDPARIDLATLVFRTIRTGFPTAEVFVTYNGFARDFDHSAFNAVNEVAHKIGGSCASGVQQPHGEWIEKLLAYERSPFWIVDSDVVFLDTVEHWLSGSDALFAGRFEPEFFEQWTKTVHVSRLHPSMMWINPVPLRAAMRGWPGKHEFFDSVQKELIRWHWVPEARNISSSPLPVWAEPRIKFYDTMSGLYHALGGVPFTDKQNAAYEHLFCSSYAGMMPGMEALEAVQRQAVADPQSARGLWQAQQSWYERNKVT